uniref:ATP synthase subunit 8 n=1 Tax=Blattisocius tarsalis TaxID=1609195 RepID=A0A6B9WDH4_9ACAR|nr:ATP synthase F0 subunit 8 [Blattisocius tarsalis]QHQ98563.1 ATP synthase subunit 8 [Blattisocius tarsalis]
MPQMQPMNWLTIFIMLNFALIYMTPLMFFTLNPSSMSMPLLSNTRSNQKPFIQLKW